MSETHAQHLLRSHTFQQADADERAYAAEVLKLGQERMLPSETVSTLLQRLHLPPLVLQGYLDRLGVYLDSHHKPLTLNELIFLQERNLITGDEVTAWTEQQGYSQNDAASIDLYVTEKALEFADAQKKKADKAAAAAAKKASKQLPPGR